MVTIGEATRGREPLLVDAGLGPIDARALAGDVFSLREEDGRSWDDAARSVLMSNAGLRSAAARVRVALASRGRCCVLDGTGFLDLDVSLRNTYIEALSSLFGDVSDDNRFDTRSRVFVDEVVPTDPRGSDVTYQIGACEPHSDESSKPRPEDVVMLWCVRPANSGGQCLVWPVADLLDSIATDGDTHAIAMLRRPEYVFGGRLRQPPRVIRAPVLFGKDGIRFRRGAIDDACAAIRQPLSGAHHEALDVLTAAIRRTQPFVCRLRAGQVLVVANRHVLHARDHFDDEARRLLRTRCHDDALSLHREDAWEWLT
jgi:hypothetical protein